MFSNARKSSITGPTSLLRAPTAFATTPTRASTSNTLKFDATLLKPGENAMTFTVPGGNLQSGVVWDYLRLELEDNH